MYIYTQWGIVRAPQVYFGAVEQTDLEKPAMYSGVPISLLAGRVGVLR